jgi:hypothetical protein
MNNDNVYYISILADIFEEQIFPLLDNLSLIQFSFSSWTCYTIIANYFVSFSGEKQTQKSIYGGFGHKEEEEYQELLKYPGIKHGSYKIYRIDELGTRIRAMREITYFRGEPMGKFCIIHYGNSCTTYIGSYIGKLLHGVYEVRIGNNIEVIQNYRYGISRQTSDRFQIKEIDKCPVQKFMMFIKKTFYLKGVVRGIAMYCSGELKLQGKCIKNYKNGKIKVIKNFARGILHGDYIKYDKEGKFLIKAKFWEGCILELRPPKI